MNIYLISEACFIFQVAKTFPFQVILHCITRDFERILKTVMIWWYSRDKWITGSTMRKLKEKKVQLLQICTIPHACGRNGYFHKCNAAPNFLAQIIQWITEKSPFCQSSQKWTKPWTYHGIHLVSITSPISSTVWWIEIVVLLHFSIFIHNS